MIRQTILLNGEPFTLIGVMPSNYTSLGQSGAPDSSAPDIWTPLALVANGAGSGGNISVLGRMKHGVTRAELAAQMAVVTQDLKSEYARNPSDQLILTFLPYQQMLGADVRPFLLVLLGAIGFVLLIACANVANLQLARTAGRAREIAVRVALGASPSRLVRQLLTESVLLGLTGGALGLLLAVWGVPALLSLNPRNLPPATEVGVDGTVLIFALLISVGTGLLFGFMPAIQVARDDLHETLKEGGRGAVGQRGSLALRRGLVVTTVAMALTLLAGAGLLIRSFSRLTAVEPGFTPGHLLTFNINLPRAKYANDTTRIAVLQRLEAAIAATPGVVAVGGTSNIPFGGNWSTASFTVEGYQRPPNTPMPWGDIRIVTTGFLPAIHATLLAGRQFTDADRTGAPSVVIVDELLAKKYWPNESAVGKRITYDDPAHDSIVDWKTIVGVVGHTLHEGLDADPRVQVYWPLGQSGMPFMGFAVRTAGEPMTALAGVRAAVQSVDADLPLAGVNTMDTLIEQSTGPRRFAMLLLGAFAAVAMILASIGLYGVMSYTVTQRSRELGVRVALGASTSEVLKLVLGQGVRLAVFGVGIGLVAALILTRLMKKMLFSVSATDPLTFIVISVALIAVALLASYLPARRATRADPIVALRAE